VSDSLDKDRNDRLGGMGTTLFFILLSLLAFGGCVTGVLSHIADALDRAHPKQEQKP
jgi:hypothetical protein